VACGGDGDGGDGSGDGTLKTVQDRGTLKCGVKESQRGFGFLEPDGSYSGSDVEFCRAVAAAVLGDADAVEFVPASAADRFELLDAGEIDVLIRTTTWTSSRDTSLNGSFAQITFYDGQGILVRADSDFQTLTDLQGATICVTGGTTTESNLEDRLSAANVAYTPSPSRVTPRSSPPSAKAAATPGPRISRTWRASAPATPRRTVGRTRCASSA